ncbi:Nucleoside 2-deoxyribosyltransferase [Hydrobacter penzbergensis]|uniref:Nucleoside 2-deoxyribosyltransferase n=1 Tax=Hydrobacter penzbergensis TaxID=1235997 RepID=A0A8X8LB01_9BACT|nr:nucleoside 2-deoxyribosyltransferase [Hydrobacter penzbergensis]SDW64703.1 Nucleoside 2-deoxyribosyltransferase [Hydrobacter penzbergensis]
MTQTNWITISGKAEVKDNTIKYKSETFKNQLAKEEILSSVVKSNISFDNGEISFKIISKSQYGRCQVIFNYDDAPMILVGLNVNNGLYGITKYNRSNNNFEPLSITGMQETFQSKQEYAFKIKVYGSIIELFVNDVLVSTAYEQLNQSQITFFFSSTDEIMVRDIRISTKKPKAFIVMQFTEEYNQLYNEVIKPVVEEFGFECERADEAHTTNPILQDIIQSIRQSSVIIADITPNNPNVFYEVGYAHATSKPTILLCDRKRDKLPFDISGFRTLFYDNTIAGKTAVEKRLKKYLEAQTNN